MRSETLTRAQATCTQRIYLPESKQTECHLETAPSQSCEGRGRAALGAAALADLLVSHQTVQSLTVSPACSLLSPQPSTARRQVFFSRREHSLHIMVPSVVSSCLKGAGKPGVCRDAGQKQG